MVDTIREGHLGKPPVICDLTAVGPTIVPVLRKAGLTWVVPVVLTTALEAAEIDRTWRLPKRDLVTGLQLALQQRRLRVAPGLPEADLFVRELQAFRATITLDPTEAADWRSQPGDDLVLAVALAVWWGNRHPAGPMTIASGGNEELHALLDRVFPDRAAWRPGPW